MSKIILVLIFMSFHFPGFALNEMPVKTPPEIALRSYSPQVIAEIRFNDDDKVKGLMALPNDNLLAWGVGWSPKKGISQQGFLAKFKISGTLDKSFGNDGIILPMHEKSSSSEIIDAVLTSDQKILYVATKRKWDGKETSLFIVVGRILPSGAVDESFGVKGFVEILASPRPINGNPEGTGIALQTDGKIVFTGGIAYSRLGETDCYIGRLNANGSSDYTFNRKSYLTFTTKQNSNACLKPQLSRTGDIFVPLHAGRQLAIAKVTSNGILDASFGDKGVSAYGEVGFSQAKRVLQDNNGNIYVAGIAMNGSAIRTVIVKFDSKGAIDKTFADQGFFMPTAKELPTWADVKNFQFGKNGHFKVSGGDIDSSSLYILEFTADGLSHSASSYPASGGVMDETDDGQIIMLGTKDLGDHPLSTSKQLILHFK